MLSLFGNGFKGIAESKWAGIAGSVFRAVGIDYRSVPGLIKVHQKLTKSSPSSGDNQVTELCKVAVPVSDGSTLWFSSESGKIWREVSGAWTLVYTLALETLGLLTAVPDESVFDPTTTKTKLQISPDGRYMYTIDYGGSTIRQYYLSDPYDISTAEELRTEDVETGVRSFFISPDGYKIFTLTKSTVTERRMTPAWWIDQLDDLGGLSYSLSSQTTDAVSISFSPNGLKMFVLDGGGDIHEYSLDHAFQFIPDEEGLNALLVAGGGGGGGAQLGASSGGDGGQVREVNFPFLLPGTFPVVIGAAGVGGTGNNDGTAGGDTTFNSETATGGDGGAQDGSAAGGDGAGGAHSSLNGGVGIQSSIPAVPTYFGGGGGGAQNGTPGLGGGGAGSGANSNGSDATANTGGGGGGAHDDTSNNRTGGAGAAGLLIIRYATGAYRATGGTITTSGGDTIHTFTTSSDFVIAIGISFVQTVNVTEPLRPVDFYFDPEGTTMLLIDRGEYLTKGGVLQYILDAWDITSLEYDRKKIFLNTPQGVWRDTYLFVGFVDGTAQRYSLGEDAVSSYALSAREFFAPTEDSERDEIVIDTLTGTIAHIVNLTDDTGMSNDALKVGQSFSFERDTKIDAATFYLDETGGIDGGYTIRCTIQRDSGGSPDGVAIATKDITADVNTLSDTSARLTFNFADPVLFDAFETYWVVLEITDYNDIGGSEAITVSAGSALYAGGSVKVYKSGAWTETVDTGGPTSGWDLAFQLALLNPDNGELGAESERVPYIYWSTPEYLHRIAVSNIADWADKVETVGKFKNGHTQHHPMAMQNLSLFIGDGNVLAEVDDVGTFVQETELNLPDIDVIQALYPFDTDLLIGSKAIKMGHVRRWDTVSESWSAQDEIYDAEGVTAFLGDDNYVYPITGPFGRVYFYDGEKMVPYVQIPGEWGPSKKAVVHANSVGFWMNMPVFGLSNSTGNPQLQGIYGLGSAGRGFDKTLSLDFPISAGTFDNITIGAILVRGADLMIAWKTASAAGVDKLDWSAKYASAYFETRILTDIMTARGVANARHIRKTLKEVAVPYAELPADTGITMAYKKKNESSYTNLEAGKDQTDDQKLYFRQTVPAMAAPQLRATFTVDENNAPAIEDVLVDISAAE
jgi:hypothetical protein